MRCNDAILRHFLTQFTYLLFLFLYVCASMFMNTSINSFSYCEKFMEHQVMSVNTEKLAKDNVK